MEQLVIAYKKLREVERLLAAANERELGDEAEALAERVDRRNVQRPRTMNRAAGLQS